MKASILTEKIGLSDFFDTNGLPKKGFEDIFNKIFNCFAFAHFLCCTHDERKNMANRGFYFQDNGIYYEYVYKPLSFLEELNQVEKPVYGDVMILSNQHGPVHAAVHIGNDTYIHMPGSAAEKIEVKMREDIIRDYEDYMQGSLNVRFYSQKI